MHDAFVVENSFARIVRARGHSWCRHATDRCSEGRLEAAQHGQQAALWVWLCLSCREKAARSQENEWSSLVRIEFVSAMSPLSAHDIDNIWNMFFDQEGAGDAVVWLWASIFYSIVRIVLEILFPGKVRGLTRQQHVLTLTHQALVLPLLALGWWNGLAAAPILIYTLTGAYLASASLINYTRVWGNGNPVYPGTMTR